MLRWLKRSIVVAGGAFCVTAWAAPVVTVGLARVHAGDTFDIPILISGVDDTVGLTAWQFDLSFEPDIVKPLAVTEGPFLANFGTTLYSPGVTDDGAGTITLVTDAYVDQDMPSGSGVLAMITFTAVGPGTSALSPASVFLNFSDSGFSVNDGDVQVTSKVPEPGMAVLTLFGSLLLASGARCWLRRPSPDLAASPT